MGVKRLCTSLGKASGSLLSLNYCLGSHYFSCLTAFSLFLCPLTSLICNCLRLLSGTQRRLRRLKPFPTNQKWDPKGLWSTGGTGGSCLVSITMSTHSITQEVTHTTTTTNLWSPSEGGNRQNRFHLESRTPSSARLWTLSYVLSIYENNIPTGKPDPRRRLWKSPRART